MGLDGWDRGVSWMMDTCWGKGRAQGVAAGGKLCSLGLAEAGGMAAGLGLMRCGGGGCVGAGVKPVPGPLRMIGVRVCGGKKGFGCRGSEGQRGESKSSWGSVFMVGTLAGT